MGRTALQLIEVAVLLAIAGAAHYRIVRARGPFLEDLEGVAGKRVGTVAVVADVLSALVYLAFVAAVVPIEGPQAFVQFHLEDAFDVVAVAALLVAALELTSLMLIHRVAYSLEPWPRRAPTPAV